MKYPDRNDSHTLHRLIGYSVTYLCYNKCNQTKVLLRMALCKTTVGEACLINTASAVPI